MFHFKSIKSKFLISILVLLSILFLISTIVLSNIISNSFKNNSRSEFKNTAENIAISYQILNHNLEETMKSLLGVINAEFQQPFHLYPNEIVKVGKIDAPSFYNGDKLLNNNFEPLEIYTKKSGAIATIFARMGDDFVRVTTTLKKENGMRAYGTMLGQKSPALSVILAGKTFSGKVKLFGKDYMVIYEPIKNSKQEVIGIMFIGYEFSKILDALRKEIRELKIGEHGYVSMMSNKGDLLIHPKYEGKNLIEEKDDKGKFIFKEMIESEDQFVEYPFDGVDKIAYIKHIKGFNAILIVTDSLENIYKDSLKATSIISITFILILLIVFAILLISISKIVINPLQKLHSGLNAFFSYLNKESVNSQLVQIQSNDEFGRMAQNINSNIQKIQTNIQEDTQFINEVKQIVNKVKEGYFNLQITTPINNQSLEELKITINDMLQTTNKNICSDLNKLQDTLAKYRDLDFRPRLSNETGSVAVGLNELADIINQMLIENKSLGVNLNDSSSQLLENVDQLNQSSNTAATRLEETSAALEEITGNIRQNSSNISRMTSISNDVLQSATDGHNLANQTTLSMDEINEKVNAITQAITIIDQIAFQTNILSLNAAVEAATAGEAGKGFAVVAQEVRNLASRSTEAAHEIKELVEQAAQKADNGKDIANQMINGYNTLNNNISQTIELIKDVEVASKEQQQGIEQINDAIATLDKQTQQNASIAQETRLIAIENTKIATTVLQSANSKKFVE